MLLTITVKHLSHKFITRLVPLYWIAVAYLWRLLGTFLDELEDFLCTFFDGTDSKFVRHNTPLNMLDRAQLIYARHFKIQPSIDCLIYAVRAKHGNRLEDK